MPSFKVPESDQRYVVGNVVPSMDRDGAQQIDPDGVHLWEVRVMADAVAEPGRDRLPTPEIIRIQVPATSIPQLQFGYPARFAGLVARTWSARDGRQGVMYQATAVLPAQPQTQSQPQPQAKQPSQSTETGR